MRGPGPVNAGNQHQAPVQRAHVDSQGNLSLSLRPHFEGLQDHIELLRAQGESESEAYVRVVRLFGNLICGYVGRLTPADMVRYANWLRGASLTFDHLANSYEATIRPERALMSRGALEAEREAKGASSLAQLACLFESASHALTSHDPEAVGLAAQILVDGVERLGPSGWKELEKLEPNEVGPAWRRGGLLLEQPLIQATGLANYPANQQRGLEAAFRAGLLTAVEDLCVVPTPEEEEALVLAIHGAFDKGAGSLDIAAALNAVREQLGLHSRDRMAQFIVQPDILLWMEAGLQRACGTGISKIKVDVDRQFAALLAVIRGGGFRVDLEIEAAVHPGMPRTIDLCTASPAPAGTRMEARTRIWIKLQEGRLPAGLGYPGFTFDADRDFELLSASGRIERLVLLEETGRDGVRRQCALGYLETRSRHERLFDQAHDRLWVMGTAAQAAIARLLST